MASRRTAKPTGRPRLTSASFQAFFEHAAYASAVFRQDDERILAVNAAWERTFGYSRDEVLGRTAVELGIVGDASARAERLERLKGLGPGEALRDIRIPLRLRSGEVRTFLTTLAVADVDGVNCVVSTAHDITQQIAAESELREQERRVRAATEAGQVGLWEWDIESDRYWLSGELRRQLGMDESAVGATYDEWRSRVHQDDLGTASARIRAAIIDDRMPLDHEYRMRHRDGSWRWVLARASIVRDATGRATRMLGSHVDITEQKSAARAIARLNRVRGMLSAVNQLIIREWEPEAMLARACQIAVKEGEAWMAWVGLVGPPEMPMELAAIAGGDAEAQADVLRILATSGCSFTAEALVTGRPTVCRDVGNDDRTLPWRAEADRAGIRSMASLPLTARGERTGTINLYAKDVGFFDETEIAVLAEFADDLSFGLEVAQRRRERRAGEARIARQQATLVALTGQEKLDLWDAETALARIVESAAESVEVERVSIWRYEEGRARIRCIDLFEASTRRHSSGLLLEQVGAPAYFRALEAFDVIDASDAMADPRTTEFTEGYLRPLDIRSMLDAPIHIHGERAGVLCLESIGRPRTWTPDERTYAIALANLVSLALESAERRRGQTALLESEARFRELAESIREVFWVTDPQKHSMLYISPQYETVWGRPVAELLAEPMIWLETVHPDDRPRVREAVTRQVHGDYDEIYRISRPDGEERWIHDRAFPVQQADGHVERIVGVARDITDVRHLEEQLRQSQKMEAVGLLAGGIAHDFNNILAAILMQAELAGSTLGVPAEAREGLLQIRAAAERAANLTRQLLLFGRRQLLRPVDSDLNDLVSHLAGMLRRIIGEDVTLALDLTDEPLVIHADSGMVDQVLLNLCINARDATVGGGDIIISTAAVESGPDDHERPPDSAPGRYVRLRVADHGTGIPADVLPRIFEPFFTTKAAGKGTGLGLATVFGIVRQHHGWIVARNRPAGGAAFDVFFPLASAERLVERQDEATSLGKAGTETVLLAEDEPLVRSLAERVLLRQGYRVLSASTGAEALQLARESVAPISLLVSDLVMPGGMNGRELAQRLVAERPGLRVLFTSGYSAELAGQELQLEHGEQFLGKPFTTSQLLAAVRQTIDAE